MLGTPRTRRTVTLLASTVVALVLTVPGTAAAQGTPRPATGKAATPSTRPTTYTVKAGDTLYTIARSLGVSFNGLLEANKMTLTSLIVPGQVLVVPKVGSVASKAPVPTTVKAKTTTSATTTTAPATTYTLQPGEGLWTVANRFGVKLGPLLKANGLTITSVVHPGTVLIVPAGGVVASPSTGASGQVTTTTTAPTTTTPTPTSAPPTTIAPASTPKTDVVVAFALAQVGKPYEFNSAGPDTFDCSGLTLAAYSQIGVRLPHQSAMQATRGTAVDWRAEPIRPGDLVFTISSSSTGGVIGHVGLAISATQWVHAPRAGDVVKIGTIPSTDKIQAVRRFVTP